MQYDPDDAKFFQIPDGDVETPPTQITPMQLSDTYRIPCRNMHQPRRNARYQCRRQKMQHQNRQENTNGAGENAAGVGECSFGCCSVIALILISCIAGMFMAMFAFPQLARSLCANI